MHLGGAPVDADRPRVQVLVELLVGGAEHGLRALELHRHAGEILLGQFGNANFSTFKTALVDLAVARLGPICTEMKRLQGDQKYLDDVLKDGADRARVIAAANMRDIKGILGFIR